MMPMTAAEIIDRDAEIVEHSKRLGDRTAALLDRYLRHADNADHLAQIENLAGLLRSALAYNLALGSEVAHYCGEMRQARTERDEALTRVQELEDELDELRGGLANGIAASCGCPSEVTLPDGGTAVLS
ncbi:hypothetical protein CL81_gp37 [Mycobacterium phage Charlie]|uniref:Uncharacterized protein n=2 Tax=Charlievirus TaxID=1623280 RepID=G1FTX5_9CAUD|nr:hypothetical protein CL81_gp37 [Mycobacterium phage Charlie]YP_009595725.1 hypothetical protein FDG99_gp34 [Mycobacterium phage SkinnyPete]AEL19960.1 hypothetical protein CHARLIE_37 [Mycobacterium phage Charlie]AMU78464.1 hypothetical protein SEA_SKINNYPETE_34 [Mycobacterium phage SkinnyPete]